MVFPYWDPSIDKSQNHIGANLFAKTINLFRIIKNMGELVHMIGIQGIDKVIFTKIPNACSIVVEGDTGALKTTFVAETIKSSLIKEKDKMCLFFSLKDNIEHFRKRFEQTGTSVEQEQLVIFDYDSLLDRKSPTLSGDNIFKSITEIIKEFKEKYEDRLAFVVIDPINVLYANFSQENLRRNLYHFFSSLTDLKTQNWVISEKVFGGLEEEAALPCHFLSDGIVELGILETSNDVIRYIEIKKMRGVNHSLKRFQISYKKNIIKILGCAYE
jgi:KaiC/GvpD/RAD55 family RecA-like ATPase